MTDLHNEVPVTSDPTPRRKAGDHSVVKAIRTFNKVWKAFSAIFVLIVAVIFLLFVATNHGAQKSRPGVDLSGGSLTDTTSNQPAATQAPVVDPGNNAVVNGIPRDLPLLAPPESDNPTVMAKKIAQLRRDAFCAGGNKGNQIINQVWASHDDPKPLAYSIESAYDTAVLAPSKPSHTFATDINDIKSEESAPGNGCNFGQRGSLMTVVDSYLGATNERVVVSVWMLGSHFVDGYTGVYDLIDGHWYINQLH